MIQRRPIIAPLVFLLSALSITSISHGQTFSDYDTKMDFSKYKTYAWIAPGDSVLNRVRRDKLFGGFIMNTANSVIKNFGMAIDTLQPDALFVFETTVHEEVKYSQSPTLSMGVGFGGPGYYVGGSAPVAGGKVTSSTYQKGSLVYMMFDTRTGTILWRGGITKNLDNQSNLNKVIESATKTIFKKFPKKKVKKKKK
jgi:hypothetical protein